MTILHLDFEVSSAVDLKTAGLYRYAADPSTRVLLLGWAINKQAVQVWDATLGRPMPAKLARALADPKIQLCAFNAAFERIILRDTLKIDTPIDRWHCIMVHGFSLGFSGGLGEMAKAVGLSQQKDIRGRQLIARFCCPQPASRKVQAWDRHNDPEGWAELIQYCEQDVRTERELQDFFDQYPMGDELLQGWYLDQTINDRGLPIDRQLVTQALKLADQAKSELMAELSQLTGLDNPNSNQQLQTWLQAQGVACYDLQAATVTRLLEDPQLRPLARQVLELKQQLAKSSVAKYVVLDAATTTDGRIRGTLQYLGASRTGRWAGRLLQPQNFPRPAKGIDVDATIDAILNERSIERPLHALAAALRGTIAAGKGNALVVADLAGIEGRVLPWACGFQSKLNQIRAGRDMYKVAAAGIYHCDYEEVDNDMRFVGKVCELALGYAGGIGALNTMATAYGLPPYDDAVGKPIVDAWRAVNQPIVRFWADCQRAAKLALSNRGRVYNAGCVSFVTDQHFLQITLPSNRILYYFQPLFDEENNLTFMGVDPYTHKWGRVRTYSGKIVENIIQAISRDILAANMPNVEAAGFKIVTSIHDELLTEQRTAKKYSADALCRLMTRVPAWAQGLPLNATGYTATRYRKG